MVKCCVNCLGLSLLILLLVTNTSSHNITERSPADSFIVSANYGIQSEHSDPNPDQYRQNSGFIPNSFQHREDLAENSHAEYHQEPYQTNDGNRWSSMNAQYSDDQNRNVAQPSSRSSDWNYSDQNMLPTPSAWQGHLETDPYRSYDAQAKSNSYYQNYWDDSESSHHHQAIPEGYISYNGNSDQQGHMGNTNLKHKFEGQSQNTMETISSQNSRSDGQSVVGNHDRGHLSPSHSDKEEYSNNLKGQEQLELKYHRENTENQMKDFLRNYEAADTTTREGTFNSFSVSSEPNNQDNMKHQHSDIGDTVYGSRNPENVNEPFSTTNTVIINERTNDRAYETQWPSNGYQVKEILDERSQPNMMGIKNILGQIIRGNSKVHQVIKVPAVYEIHLQEDEKRDQPGSAPAWSSINSRHRMPYNQIPPPSRVVFKPELSKWSKTSQFSSAANLRPWRNGQTHNGDGYSMRMWNLPSKINYFERDNGLYKMSGGKYSYSQPSSSWSSSSISKEVIKPTSPPIYGSVSVPITPGTTEVILSDFGGSVPYRNSFYAKDGGQQRVHVMPDMSHYYAVKEELENGAFSGVTTNDLKVYDSHNSPINTLDVITRNGNQDMKQNAGNTNAYHRTYQKQNKYRRIGAQNTKRNIYRGNSQSTLLPLNNLNYIIHVREKSDY